MTARTFHIVILRNAALLVPASVRDEWLAEWKAELCYVDREATAFCLGSFRDALWLRRNNSEHAARPCPMDSPLRCICLLTGLALSTFSLNLPSVVASLPPWSGRGVSQLTVGILWWYLLALLVLSTASRWELGEHSAPHCALPLRLRFRTWIFLCAKIALVVPVPVFICCAVLTVFPPAPFIVLLGWIFGFRWILDDQRRRCPICIHLLSHPVRIGQASEMIFGWYGTEFVCTRGHGSLYVPAVPTSWSKSQSWHSFDASWRELIP